jgi:hypothetical protein
MTMGFILATVGDIGCQMIEDNKKYINDLDMTRSIKMGLIRAFAISPFIHVYYPWLERISPGKSAFRVLSRVVLDQIVGSPIVIIIVLGVNSFISKTEDQSSAAIMGDKFLNAWRKGVQFWPFIHSINFSFVPLPHRPLVAHFASIYWNYVLSYYANSRQ